MKALDDLRTAAKMSRDSHVEYLIELWIQRHVVELGNTLTVTGRALKESRLHGHLERENKHQIRNLAEAVIEAGSQFTEVPYLDGIQRTRRVYIIKEDA